MINKNCFGFLYFLMKHDSETFSFIKSDKKSDWKMKTKIKFEIGFFSKSSSYFSLQPGVAQLIC